MKNKNIWKVVKEIARILVGLVFVFSGFVKAVDPLGGTYKFEDYFTAFGWDFLTPYALLFSILLSGLEFITGLALLTRSHTRFFSWIALGFMVVFTPLTLYIAINNPVTDCGCFGDAVKLSNWATFYKNIIISLLVIITFVARKEYNSYKKQNWTMALGIFFIGGIMWYGLVHLPIIDFRPYKIGNNIPELMKIPENAPQDEYIYYYTMKNSQTGETKTIDSKEYVDSKIWQDTTWKIIETSDPVLVKEGYHPPVHDFVIETIDGGDITDSVLNSPTYLLLISYDVDKFDKDAANRIRKVADISRELHIPILFWTASSATKTYELLNELKINLFPVCFGDEINLKTIVRSNPGLVLLKRGVVAGKWSAADMPNKADLQKALER